MNECVADVNITDIHGKTPLHYAINYCRSIELTQLLLDHGDYYHHHCPCRVVDAKDDDGNTPLYYARDVQVVRLLLRYGAKVNMRNIFGKTPIYNAVQKYSVQVIEELLYFPNRGCRISDDNAQDPKSVLHHDYYDYERIHWIKTDNGLSPYDLIPYCLKALNPMRLVQTFDQYEEKQQQLKRSIIYSYLLLLSCCHKMESKTQFETFKEEVG